MKTQAYLSSIFVFLSLAFHPTLFGQGVTDYTSNEFVVIYDQATLDGDRTVLRNFYGITSYHPILNGAAEIWQNIHFPIVTDSLDILFNIEDLELDINNSSLGDTDPRARVSDGDFQYMVDIEQAAIPYSPMGGTTQVLPFCDNEGRIMGTLGDPDRPQNIIIIDQLLDMPGLNGRTNTIEVVTDHPGGDHANRVTWVIDQILGDLGATDVTFHNIAAFDATGSARYTDLLIAFDAIQEAGLTDAILNFSANLSFATRDLTEGNYLSKLVNEILETQNILMISSAGNDGSSDENVFPGCVGLTNEISVAGSDGCFVHTWSNSNSNPNHYDIVAEANDVLTFDGYTWALAAGTSFSAPLVTAAAAQVNSHTTFFSPRFITNKILRYADENSEFFGTVESGRILNATSSTNWAQPLTNWETDNQAPGEAAHPAAPGTIRVYPNPVVDMLQIELPAGEYSDPLQVQIQNLNQQVVGTYDWLPGAPLMLDQLPAGYYILEIRSATHQWVTRLSKI